MPPHLTVTVDGSGLAAAPDGVRVEVVGDGHGGAGLGLPPARRPARSAGGEVWHGPGHTPEARFVVSPPAG
ncbi:hypothetical protein ACIQVT_20360 [Streptomyces sp. NPDC100445]|uniref:hypothetical protein n=1 Tax=Streptomyces sp. NPDC100445 TaxID=3366102 RepID=UPI0037FCA235